MLIVYSVFLALNARSVPLVGKELFVRFAHLAIREQTATPARLDIILHLQGHFTAQYAHL